MKMSVFLATLAAAAFALAACTNRSDQRAGAGDQCFWPSQVTGFNDAPGRDRIYVNAGPRDVFLFETFGPCPELDFTQALAFDYAPGGTICSGIDVTLIVPTSIGPQRCPVRMIRKLSGTELTARGSRD